MPTAKLVSCNGAPLYKLSVPVSYTAITAEGNKLGRAEYITVSRLVEKLTGETEVMAFPSNSAGKILSWTVLAEGSGSDASILSRLGFQVE